MRIFGFPAPQGELKHHQWKFCRRPCQKDLDIYPSIGLLNHAIVIWLSADFILTRNIGFMIYWTFNTYQLTLANFTSGVLISPWRYNAVLLHNVTERMKFIRYLLFDNDVKAQTPWSPTWVCLTRNATPSLRLPRPPRLRYIHAARSVPCGGSPLERANYYRAVSDEAWKASH